jgi:hypothetical protein
MLFVCWSCAIYMLVESDILYATSEFYTNPWRPYAHTAFIATRTRGNYPYATVSRFL